MPNWVENEMLVEGPEDMVAAFAKAVAPNGSDPEQTGALSFESLVPEPADLPETVPNPMSGFPDATLPGWYAWHVEHWGTKWDVDEADVTDEQPGLIAYRFLTAWSPPEAFVEAASALYPELSFTLDYDEPGMGFSGRLTAKAGVLSGGDY